jgi:hypothetical protein
MHVEPDAEFPNCSTRRQESEIWYETKPSELDVELPPDRQVPDRGSTLAVRPSLYLTLAVPGFSALRKESPSKKWSSGPKSVVPLDRKSGYNSGNAIATGGSCETKVF